MIEKLQKIYSSNDANEAFIEIIDLQEKYKKLIKSKSYKMSEKDVVLITYGDQITREGEDPLKTLGSFLDEYVKDIISTVHILPFYPYSSDDGFSVIDYNAVSPKLGSWSDIELLSKNYRLMFDGVINHISQSSSWFKKFLANDKDYKDFFVEVDPLVDFSKVIRPRTLPLIHEYEDVDKKQRFIWTTFSRDQVDLNFSNYKVLVAVVEVLLFYIQKGASLIRLDAIAFIWKQIDTSCIHLTQTHALIQIMRQVIQEVAPEVILVTETNVPHSENISYFGNGENEAQMVYNFALPPLIAHSILNADATAITTWAKSLSLPSDKVCFFNFTASHDGCGVRALSGLVSNDEVNRLVNSVENRGGFVSYRRGDDGFKSPYELNASYIDIISDPKEGIDLRVKKMILSQAISLAMPGVAGIYFHSFVGSIGDIESVNKTGVLRSINREKFTLEDLSYELEELGTLRSEIYKSYKKLLSIRISESSFNPYARFSVISLHESLFTIRRYSKDESEEILAIHNFSDCLVKCTLPIKGSYDILSNIKFEKNDIEVEPYKVLWIKSKKDKND